MASEKQVFINQLHENEPRWFAVYSAFKKEKFAQKLLDKKGITTYLPIQKVIRKYERKIKRLEIPLISCYIFVKITKSEYTSVLETEYVSRFIKIGKDLMAIPDAEIELMQRILNENVPVEAEERKLYEGDEVMIARGSLTGMKGKLVAIQGKEKVVVLLETLGYALHLELDKNLLTRV
jgi:transcription antitermination factor NusG